MRAFEDVSLIQNIWLDGIKSTNGLLILMKYGIYMPMYENIYLY